MQFYKYIVISLVAIFAASDISVAQSYSLNPDDSISILSQLEDVETLSIQQINISTDTIILKWQKISESVPLLWDAYVCDNSNCYTSLIDSGTMNPLLPTDYGFLLLHITAHINAGTAIIKYAIWNSNNSAMKDTLTFIMTVNSTVSTQEIDNKNLTSIFPNPTSNDIKLKTNFTEGFQYSILEINGKELIKGNTLNKDQEISVQEIKNGSYIISIYNSGKLINSEKVIIKH